MLLICTIAVSSYHIAFAQGNQQQQRQEASASFSGYHSSTLVRPSPTSQTMEGFSLYQNPVHNVSIQFPSAWDKQEISRNNYVAVVEFLIPTDQSFAKEESLESAIQKAKGTISNPPIKVISMVKSLLPYETHTLQDITTNDIHSLGIRFDNFSLLKTSYDRKMGKISASELIYTYTDTIGNHLDKKGIQVTSVKGYKEITITYSSQPQDFDKFLPTVETMINTVRIEE
jgi:hypothetical protein